MPARFLTDGHYDPLMPDRYPIREALELLRPMHPDVNVSKIRWLEGEDRIRAIRGVDGRLQYDPQEIAAVLSTLGW